MPAKYHDYAAATAAGIGTHSFTVDTLKRSIRLIQWTDYEVDPEWERFCQFGPEDIGGPWEKLGVIRRRRPIASMIVSEDVAAWFKRKVDRVTQDQAMAPPMYMPGIPVYVDPSLPRGITYIMRGI